MATARSEVTPDWKPDPRIVDPAAGWAKLVAEGRCRVCSSSRVTRAHLVPRAQGGDDVDDNLVPLCGHGTAGCHGAFDRQIPTSTVPATVIRSGDEVSRILWSRLTPAEQSYVVTKENIAWAERRFRLT